LPLAFTTQKQSLRNPSSPLLPLLYFDPNPTLLTKALYSQRMRLKPRTILGTLDRDELPSPWSHIAKSFTARLLGLSALLWILSYGYLHFISSRNPTSYFFDAATGYERRCSMHREQQAYDFIRTANTSFDDIGSITSGSVHVPWCRNSRTPISSANERDH